MGMTLTEIKSKIGRRVGDPLLETYSDVVQDYFEQAFALTLKKYGDSDAGSEILPSLETKQISVPVNDNYIAEYKISDIIGVMYVYSIDAPVGAYNTFKRTSKESIETLSNNILVPPQAGISFWCIDGDVIRIFSYSIGSPVVARVKYIKNPVPELWNGDLSSLGYGYNFLYDCIETAATLLRRQIGIGE